MVAPTDYEENFLFSRIGFYCNCIKKKQLLVQKITDYKLKIVFHQILFVQF